MSRQTLKDRNYSVIGYIDTDAHGKQKAMDKNFRTLGYYDPKTDKTTNANYTTIGTGNQLASLIHK